MARLYVKQPRLREGSQIAEGENCLILRRGEEVFELHPVDTSVSTLSRFLRRLDGTMTVDELVETEAELTPDQVKEMLATLDENWLLAEGREPVFSGKSGLAFVMELEDRYREWMRESGESELTRLLLSGQAPRNLVIGWTFEYYHVTRQAHHCISPAIAKSQGRIREMMIRFFEEEYRHDKLLMKSLLSVGFTEEEIAQSIPLPYTAAVSNMLAKWAHTDLLSFMASLFIFEGTATDGNEYIAALKEYGLPDDFVHYQSVHNDINIDGGHGNATRDFYAEIEYIGREDQQRVMANLRLLHETNIAAHNHAVAYYGNPGAVIPRTLDRLCAER